MLKEIFGESEAGSIIGVVPPKQVADGCAIVPYMADILKCSVTETREMIVAMEEYIEEKNIIELADFSKAIRYDYPEWHTILATKMTMYFNAFIRSCRHKANKSVVRVIQVDDHGEIL